MHIKLNFNFNFAVGGTHTTNNVDATNSTNSVVNIGATPPPGTPPKQTNWTVLAVQAAIAIVGLVATLAKILGPLLAG
ncbi:hypothetical protein [Stenotrophomonas maltophilia]|uniref:hypothetical protein n=1 Tax=Stenotrophomonas maltophilia TaxID=40324 RepID=UPI001F21F8FE|nr:hypothetical protein [Stenotrophomonas maltophilia]